MGNPPDLDKITRIRLEAQVLRVLYNHRPNGLSSRTIAIHAHIHRAWVEQILVKLLVEAQVKKLVYRGEKAVVWVYDGGS